MTSEVMTRTKTTAGTHSHPLWCWFPTTIHQMIPASTSTPSQPVTARAGRCVMSTWAPWGPTGSASIGEVTVLMWRSWSKELIVIAYGATARAALSGSLFGDHLAQPHPVASDEQGAAIDG